MDCEEVKCSHSTSFHAFISLISTTSFLHQCYLDFSWRWTYKQRQKLTNYTHKHDHRPRNHLKCLISYIILMWKKVTGRIISAVTKRVTAMTRTKLQIKHCQCFQLWQMADVCLVFEVRTSITAQKLQFMFSQDALLSIRGQCCVLLIHGSRYIFIFLSVLFFNQTEFNFLQFCSIQD